MFTTELEAAQAYDRESVLRKGVEAITNFDLSHYTEHLSNDDLEEARRRGLLSAPEVMVAEDCGELGLWHELPDQDLSDMASLLQGMSTSSVPVYFHSPQLALAGTTSQDAVMSLLSMSWCVRYMHTRKVKTIL